MALLMACAQEPAPTDTPAPTLAVMPTATPLPTPTPAIISTETPEPTATIAPTYTPVPTWTPVPTATNIPTPVPDPTATPTPIPTEGPTLTPIRVSTSTPVPVITAIAIPTPIIPPTTAPVVIRIPTAVLPTLAPPPPTPFPIGPTLAPAPTAVLSSSTEEAVSKEHFTDKWAYVVEEEVLSLCLEHEGQDVDLVQIVFGLQPSSELAQWEDKLPVSLAKLDAGLDEPMQYWFTEVPEPGTGNVDTPDNMIVPSAFSYDGETYTLLVALVDMRESIDQGEVVFLVHGAVGGKEQFLRFIVSPICQYPPSER